MFLPQHLSYRQVYEDELSAQQSAYSVEGVDENAPIERPKKRKKKEVDYTGDIAAKKAKENGQEDDKPRRERHNTSVYVSNLPKDVSVEEVVDYFSKCGVIGEDASGQKRVKLYHDENGQFKGDALVTYFKPESVPLALQLLDETELIREDGRPSPLIRVQVVCGLFDAWLMYRLNGRMTKIRKHKANRKRERRDRPMKNVVFNGDGRNWKSKNLCRTY
jgi:RNA recognition motif-containing protein